MGSKSAASTKKLSKMNKPAMVLELMSFSRSMLPFRGCLFGVKMGEMKTLHFHCLVGPRREG